MISRLKIHLPHRDLSDEHIQFQYHHKRQTKKMNLFLNISFSSLTYKNSTPYR